MRRFHFRSRTTTDMTPWEAYQAKRRSHHSAKRRQQALQLPAVSALRRHNQWRNLALVLVPLLVLLGFFGYMVSPAAKVGQISVTGESVATAQGVIDASGLTETDPVLTLFFRRAAVAQRIKQRQPAVAAVQLRVTGFNHIHLNVREHAALGYVEKQNRYHLLMADGAVLASGTATPATNYPIFSGFSAKQVLPIARTVHGFPAEIRRAVSEVRATKGGANPYQISLTMTDGNRIVADSRTIGKRIKYYREIIAQVKGHGTVDLEVGAYFTPNSTTTKK